MLEKFVINFKDIISELETKKLKLCFLVNRGLFITDNYNNLYQMELYRVGSYLDNLIKKDTTVEFSYVDSSFINESEKEVWDIPKVKKFIERCNKIII